MALVSKRSKTMDKGKLVEYFEKLLEHIDTRLLLEEITYLLDVDELYNVVDHIATIYEIELDGFEETFGGGVDVE